MPHTQGINQTRAHIARRAMDDAFIAEQYANGRTRSIQRALVYEVIPNLQQIDNDTLVRLEDSGVHQETIGYLPRNSIIAQLVSNIAIANRKIVLFPFFSPHISIPIKPGEYVWAFFEDPTALNIGFWLSRIHETEHVDDLNFTHGDRKFTQDGNPSIKPDADEKKKLVGFPNGNGYETQRTFTDLKTFDDIENNATANAHIRKEPVPRFTKRPGDTVLQGSNNAVIVLGEDRTGGLDTGHTDGLAGTVDIVAGRGLEFTANTEVSKGTSPSIVETTRGYSEVDKNPRTENEANVNEGDPDFALDKTRIYASMRTDGDDNFSIIKPSNVLDADAEPTKERAYIVHKSDEVRIIAREDGAIHIIKEGENSASIIVHANGTVQIDAKKIQLGRDVGDNKGYVKYSEFKSQMEILTQLLLVFFGQVQAGLNANAPPGSFIPDPGITKAGLAAGVALKSLTSIINANNVNKARSTVIFGE